MISLNWYRSTLVLVTVMILFTNFSDYSQKFGIIPLKWIMLFIAMTAPLAIPALLSHRVSISPLVIWGVGYLLITIIWYYPSLQNAESFRDVRLRFLSVITLYLMLFLLSRPQDQHTARVAVAISVLIAVTLNVYELFNPLTFSTIPGRSSGLYTNVNQSGAALVLGMIIAYEIIPNRLKMLFIGLTAVGIITTFSRAAILGWVLVVFYFAFRSGIGIAQVRRIAIMGVIVFGFIVSPFWGDLQQSLEARGTLTLDVVQRLNFLGSGNTSDASSQERSSVATVAWRYFSQRPITGYGTGKHRQIEGYEVGIHNVYLAMMVDHGILGLFILPLLILAAIWGLPRSQLDLALPFAMFLSLWGLFSHNVLEERYILVAVALVGSIVASNRVRVPKPASVLSQALMPAGATLMTGRPRIAHIISGLGPGGAEIMLLELVRQSVTSAFEPLVINLANVTGLVPEFEKLGVPVVTMGMNHGIPDPRNLYRLRKMLIERRVAVVQTWMYHANLIGGLAAKSAGSIPVAWGIHHTDLSPDYIKRSTLLIAKACVPLSRRIPSAIVCVAETSKRVHTNLGYATDNMLVIPNGFDIDRFRPDPAARVHLRDELGLPHETKLVGLLARFNPQKDHKNFIDAAAIVAKANPDTHFVLCGWGVTPENADLSAWIQFTGFGERFHLLGRRADTPMIDAALDVVALSSVSGEAFPLVIGEAMSCGVPCAVTDVGDSRLIVGDLGRVAPPENPAALAGAIRELLDLGPEERARVSAASRRKIAENYSLAEIARRYDHLWQQIHQSAPVAVNERSVPCV